MKLFQRRNVLLLDCWLRGQLVPGPLNELVVLEPNKQSSYTNSSARNPAVKPRSCRINVYDARRVDFDQQW